jgi:hypothetical protein
MVGIKDGEGGSALGWGKREGGRAACSEVEEGR